MDLYNYIGCTFEELEEEVQEYIVNSIDEKETYRVNHIDNTYTGLILAGGFVLPAWVDFYIGELSFELFGEGGNLDHVDYLELNL